MRLENSGTGLEYYDSMVCWERELPTMLSDEVCEPYVRDRQSEERRGAKVQECHVTCVENHLFAAVPST